MIRVCGEFDGVRVLGANTSEMLHAGGFRVGVGAFDGASCEPKCGLRVALKRRARTRSQSRDRCGGGRERRRRQGTSLGKVRRIQNRVSAGTSAERLKDQKTRA